MTIAGRKRRDLLERFLAVARRFGDEAPALDELLEADARRRFVFDDQDALGNVLVSILSLTTSIPSASGCRHSAPQPCHFYILPLSPRAR